MSAKNNVCDFCGFNTILSATVDDLAVIFSRDGVAKMWCGHCRAGSDEYFMDLTSEEMVYLINLSDEALLALGESPDAHLMEAKRVWLENEVYRAKKELVFRVMEAT